MAAGAVAGAESPGASRCAPTAPCTGGTLRAGRPTRVRGAARRRHRDHRRGIPTSSWPRSGGPARAWRRARPSSDWRRPCARGCWSPPMSRSSGSRDYGGEDGYDAVAAWLAGLKVLFRILTWGSGRTGRRPDRPSISMTGPLYALLPPADETDADSDVLLGRFLDYVTGKGLDALSGPGGGDPRAARGQERHPEHADRLGQVAGRVRDACSRRWRAASAPSTPARSRRWSTRSGWRSAASSGPDHVGLSTGDATVNRDAPILCCTAEVLANIALREGRRRRRRRRGDGRVPLLRRPRPRRRVAGAAADACRRRASC